MSQMRNAPETTKLRGAIGLGAPKLTFSFKFAATLIGDLNNLDQWLEQAYQLDTAQLFVPDPKDEDAVLKEPRAFINRALAFAQALVDGGRIPLFDQAALSNLARLPPTNADEAPQSADYEVKIITPYIDVITPAQLYTIYKEALLAAGRMSKTPLTPQNRQAEYQHFNNKIILPIAKQAARGTSTQAVLRTAHENNIPFIHRAGALYQIGWGCKAVQIDRSSVGADSAMASVISNSKRLTAKVLADAGLPAAKHINSTTLESAQKAAQTIGWPLVVKPADAERGEGVHINVTNNAGLERAFQDALKASPGKQVLIEEQVSGTCHRIFISNGELLYAVKRCPKSIIGDGQSSVRALAETANQIALSTPPWRREPLCKLDEEALQQINRAGHTLKTIPAKGELIHLREIESTLSGGYDIEVTHQVHPENLRIALQAAKLAGLSNAGIDILSEDIAKPWIENGAIINEINYAPLLGGGEISRSHLQTYLSRLITDDGRIPVDIYVGGDSAMAQAKEHQKNLHKNGQQAYLTSHAETLDGEQALRPYPFKSLARRTKALLLENTVEALILVVQNADVLETGLPVDKATLHLASTTAPFPRINEVTALLAPLQ